MPVVTTPDDILNLKGWTFAVNRDFLADLGAASQ
jgi:hypothetical protein